MSTATEYPSAVAVARFVRVSPTKARRVIDLVRGKSVADALDILRWAPQAAHGWSGRAVRGGHPGRSRAGQQGCGHGSCQEGIRRQGAGQEGSGREGTGQESVPQEDIWSEGVRREVR